MDDLGHGLSNTCYTYDTATDDCLIGTYTTNDTIDCNIVTGNYNFIVNTNSIPSLGVYDDVTPISATLTLGGLKGSVTAACSNCPSGIIFLL